MGGGDTGDHALHRLAHLGAPGERQRAHGAADRGRAGDHVAGGAGLERRHRDDDGVERVGLARDDLLQVRDHLRGDGDRVDGLVRVRAVPAAPEDLEREQVCGGHHRARRRRDVPGLEARRADGRPQRGRRRRARPRRRRRARRRAAAPRRAGRRTAPRRRARRGARRRSCAAPSSIAVWPSCPQACITPGRVETCGMSFSSRIGSASMSARRTTTLPGPGAVQPRHDRGPGRPLDLEPAERAQRLLDEGRRLVLLERQLGVRVQVPAPRDRARFEVVRDEA